MTDLAAVVMALAAAAGARVALPLPIWLAALAAAAALRLRRPALLALATALAASGLAARSWAGLHPPVTGSWSGTATLATDPVEVAGAMRVDLRIAGKRVEAWARGAPAGRLRPLLAGERVSVSGHVQELPDAVRGRVAHRHVGGRMTVTAIELTGPGGRLDRFANRLRRTLAAGASSLPDGRRALFTGFVLGDGRGQHAEVVHDFRASGLSHLLVVSGQNVAFVLALAGPALSRLGLRWRFAAAGALLVVFGTLTRWEPSVLRAVGMTSVALFAATAGRPATGIRNLALAVTALLLVDPLLVRSLGFLLSVGATAGLAVLAGPISSRLPGPRPLARVTGTTLAAQLGVAPILIPVFGGIPISTLAANLAAGPVAGPLMMWGLAAGLPAGLLTPGLAGAAHIPTGIMVGWIAGVARVGAALPLGQLGPGAAVAAAILAGAAWLAFRRGHRPLGSLALAGTLAVAVAVVAGGLRPGPVDGAEVARGATLWRMGSASVLLLDGVGAAPDRLLDGLHRRSVRRLDAVVAARGSRAEAALVAVMRSRLAVGLVLAPAGGKVPGAVAPPPGAVVEVGGLAITISDSGGEGSGREVRGANPPPLAVEVGPRVAPARR